MLIGVLKFMITVYTGSQQGYKEAYILMKFIKPRNINAENVDWLISERARAVVSYYAEYSLCTCSHR